MVVEHRPASPVSEGVSFRDKITGFWGKTQVYDDVLVSDESDVEDDDDDPRCPTIRIPKSEKVRVRGRFRHAIIVNTLDRCFPFTFMSRKLPQLWAKKGDVQVSDVGFGFYVVNFESIADYERAMFGGPWMINDHYVVIQEWRPYFRPEETLLTTLRVWVRLPGIPFEYFDRTILKLIGDRIGRTVRIDHTTLEGSRGNFARICVEVDLSKPLLSKYRLRRRVRRIEYEGLHTICFNCGCYGHKDEACKVAAEEVVSVNQTTSFANPIFQEVRVEEVRPEVEEDFGPWMQVKKSRRKLNIGVTTGPSTATKTAEVKKGNSFAALVDLESPADSGEGKSKEDAQPLININEAPVGDDLVEENKENNDPLEGFQTAPGADVSSQREAQLSNLVGMGQGLPEPHSSSADGILLGREQCLTSSSSEPQREFPLSAFGPSSQNGPQVGVLGIPGGYGQWKQCEAFFGVFVLPTFKERGCFS
ncbi:hypothetical protein LINPERPRIM_LOCUS15179 [Linum perenne]